MNRHDDKDTPTDVSTPSDYPTDVSTTSDYRPPRIVALGTATDLVRGNTTSNWADKYGDYYYA